MVRVMFVPALGTRQLARMLYLFGVQSLARLSSVSLSSVRTHFFPSIAKVLVNPMIALLAVE